MSAWHRHPPRDPYRPPVEVRPLRLGRRALYDSWHWLRRPAVQRATGPVEVIHATGLAMPPPSAPVVWTLHDLAWRRDPSTFTPRGVRFFERALALAVADAALVLCSSQATIHDAVAAGLPAERLRLVPLGVHVPPAPLLAEDPVLRGVLARHGLERRYVLSVGTAEPRKNLGALVAAMAELDRRDVDLVLVGPEGWGAGSDGPGGSAISLLGDRVKRLGAVPDTDLWALYAGAAVFAYPSRWEGFGLPVLEAMAHGAPVVTSAGTACAEVTADAALLVDPEDHHALAAALGRLLDDADLAARLTGAGRVRAAELTWERTAELTAAAYAEAADA